MRMNDDEKVVEYFLIIDEVVNAMRGLREEVDEFDVVKKVIRNLNPKYETKVSTLEEKKHFDKLTLDDLQVTLTTFKMRTRKCNPIGKKTTFKTGKRKM